MAPRRRLVLTVVITLVVTFPLLFSGITLGLPVTRSCHTTTFRPSGNFLGGSSTLCVVNGWLGWLEWTSYMVALAGIVFAIAWVCLKPRSQWPDRASTSSRI
jgi:hypothetical protein